MSSTTSRFVREGLRRSSYAAEASHEVASVLDELVGDVEVWWHENISNTLAYELEQAEGKARALELELQKTRQSKQNLEHYLESQKQSAKTARDKFMHDMAIVFSEVKKHSQMQRRLAEAERKLCAMTTLERDLAVANRKVRDLQRRHSKITDGLSGVAAEMRKQSSPNILGILEDKTLLRMFSFLQAWDVISVAQVCKPFFKRVDSLFGIGSRVAREYEAPLNGTLPTSAKPAAGGNEKEGEFTATMAAALAGKLTGAEMKAILSFRERLRRQDTQIASLRAEKEDLAARLQSTEKVKEFLVDKMRDTEAALRQSIDATQSLARQHTSDTDVITFLDLRVQELERLSEDLTHSQNLLRQTLEFEKANSSQKITKLTSSYEQVKTERDAIEAQWKGQKKLLVKEVKALRQQTQQLQAERDSMYSQLESFHSAIAAIRR